jgi:uncharacterized repeat protein (TIGR01451 family)
MKLRTLQVSAVAVLTMLIGGMVGCTQEIGRPQTPVLAERLPYTEPAPRPAQPQQPRVATSLFGPYAQSGVVTGGHQRHHANENFNSLYFPNGMVNGPIVLEVLMPDQVNAGAPFTYHINVFNTADFAVRDVVVTDELPEGFTLVESQPAASSTSGNQVTWDLGTLEGKQSATIKVTGQTDTVGTLASCATVTFVPFVCASTQVVSPQLALDLTLPESVLVCDPIVARYEVSNPGTGALTNVTVSDALPAGLQTASGKDMVEFAIDRLEPGQTRVFNVNLTASRTGEFDVPATAKSDHLTAQDSASVIVRQPVLAVEKAGPDHVWVHRNLEYTITVRNTGDAPADNVLLTDSFVGNAQVVRASDNAQVSTQGNEVTWMLGTLAPQASKTVTLVLRPGDKGTIANRVNASGVCAEGVAASVQTEVRGIPAVLLEMVDLEDPIEVGNTVTYLITVTNQGSAVDTNIRVTAELEEQMQFVEARGATPGSIDGKVITFEPLPSLAPQAKAEWFVTVRALAPADVRFRTQMITDELTRPVIKTESTNFFE